MTNAITPPVAVTTMKNDAAAISLRMPSGAGGTDTDLGAYGIVDQVRVDDWNEAWSVVAAQS